MNTEAEAINDRIEASLLAGALGDAYGAPVEPLTQAQIFQKHGAAGVVTLLPFDLPEMAHWDLGAGQTGIGVCTDDTCMTAATAAALTLVRADGVFAHGLESSYFQQAYLSWALYQAKPSAALVSRVQPRNDWPAWFPSFWYASGAGAGTMEALGDWPLLLKRTYNGAGGMMRIAPVGWFVAQDCAPDAYALGCRAAALTHNGDCAQTASGALAVLIASLVKGNPWAVACATMMDRLASDPRAVLTRSWAKAALEFGTARGSNLDFEDVERLPVTLGASEDKRRAYFQAPVVWTQVLAIAAAAQEGPATPSGKLCRAYSLAATQRGDSDTVAAIVGNILGAQWGTACLPMPWVRQLQKLPALRQIAVEAARWPSISPR